MSLQSSISLLVATLDLKVVQDVVGAIRNADTASAGRRGPLGLAPAATFEPRRHVHPETLYEPRRVIHPEPRYEARPVIHPQPVYQYDPLCTAPLAPSASHITKSPFEPPWKTLPWPQTLRPSAKIKLVIHRPDSVSKGSLIDCMM